MYGLTDDASSRNSPYVREQRERWFEQHPGQEPSREMLATTNTRYALLPMASYPFPLTCQWPLFDLTGDGHLIAGCYDQPELIVYKAYRNGKKKGDGSSPGEDKSSGRELRQSLEEVARIARPYGIESLGAITMDPSGKAFALLDRNRKRVYAAAWPLNAAELRGEEGAPAPTERVVDGIETVADAQ